MKMFHNKGKHGIVFMVVLALVLQIVGPMVSDFAYANKEVDVEKSTEEELLNEEELDEEELDADELIEEEPLDEDITEIEDKNSSDIESQESEEGKTDEELEKDETDMEDPVKSEEDLENSESENLDNEEDNSEGKKGFILKLGEVTDLEGKPFDDNNSIELKDEFRLKLDWHLENGHNYKNGDKIEFHLPKGIKIQEDIPIELKDEDDTGLTVANALVKEDGTVELTFTDFVETHSNVKGYMKIISKIDEKNAEVEDGEIILKPIGEEGKIRIPIDLGERKKTIDKEGTPNKGYNADEINWEITINKMKNNLKNAKVTDALPEGTEYKEGSLKVTKLDVDLKGNVKGDLEKVEITGDKVEDGTLNIPLGDIKDAYRIEYVTTVTDDEQKTFENNAILSDNDLDDVPAKTTVTIDRGEPIKKSNGKYNAETKTISWDIEFNYNGKNLNNVEFKDSWTPEGKLDFVEGSLKFQEVTIDGDGKATPKGDPTSDIPGGGTVESVTDGFVIKGLSTDKPYKITYETKLKDRVIESIKINNTAKFGEKSDTGSTNLGQMIGVKQPVGIDYNAKTLKWEIRVNRDKQLMKNISIVDTLGKGLSLVSLDKDTVEVKVGGKEYTDYNLEVDNPFTIKFPDGYETNEEIIITYTSKYDPNELPLVGEKKRATNTANIKWTDENDKEQEKEVKNGKDLNENTKNNHWKNGSYNPKTKEIKWTIYTNYRENQIGNLIVKDNPKGNQKIIEDSAVVTELEILPSGGIKETENSFKRMLMNMIEVKVLNENVSTIHLENNLLTVNIGKTNKAYKIEYKTSLEDLSDIQKEYVNEAEIFDDDELLSELKASVGIAKAHTYGAKSGKQDGKQVHWSITVNPGQQKVANLKLADKISYNQEILEDTFKVYEASVNKEGIATKGDELLSTKYELIYTKDEDPTFTVKWNDTVERAFIVEYSTLFFAGHNEDVTNSYDVTGDNIVKDGKTDGNVPVKIKQLGSGGGSGEAGYLVIDKVDSTYGQKETKLEGAKFDLIDADTDKVLKSGITDENGRIDFGRLLFGKYKLKETEIPKEPEGLVNPNDDNTETIIINKKYDSSKDKTEYEYRVKNYVPVFAIELSKTGKDNKALKGAEFSLFDSGGTKLQTKETDKDGKILFEDLKKAGTYYVKETKAPEGYVLDETKHKVEIGDKEPVPVEVSAKNKERGTVQLIKTDQDTGEALKGVEFVLQKENDLGGYDTIKTYITNKDGQIKTSNTLEAGNYQFVETKALDGYRTNGKPVKFTVKVNSTKTQKLTMKNEQYKGSIKLVKKDAATNDLLKGAEFKLVDADGVVVKENLSTNNGGEILVSDLFLGDYQIIETKAPKGYELNETPIDVKITEDNEVIKRTMTNKKLMNITVEKKWNNGNGDTKPVTIKLLPTEETKELNEDNNWKATFEELYVYDDSGEEIDYQVEELSVDGYKPTIKGDSNKGFTVTNTELRNIEGIKTWVDNEDATKDRPESITVQLFANGKALDDKKIEASEDTSWEYKFNDLPKYDAEGKEIKYTIEELKVDGYQSTIDNFNISNLRKAKTSVKGEKKWKDEDPTDRPDEIKVNLTREVKGELDEDFLESKTVKADAKGNWLYEFDNLEEFDEKGVAYKYIIKEDKVPENYESKVEGYDIINTRIGKTEISGKKRWKDDKVKDRPETIKVNLLRNNVVIKTRDVSSNDNWEYSFKNLDKYDEDGKYYNYRVKEELVPGYAPTVKDYDITNTRSEKTSIEITKGWLDDNSKDRPDSVIVYLYRNDKLFDTVEVKADKDWVYELKNLETYDKDGQTYTYTIKEKPIKGYKTSVNGFSLTNLRVGKTEVSGSKTWKDNNSKDRPDSIIVELLQNGKSIGKTQEVKAGKNGDWKYSFKDLDKYDEEGKAYRYTIKEKFVEGYESKVNNYDIENLRVGKTEVLGEKIWQDNDDARGDRPKEITVKLLRNGKVTDQIQKVEADEDGDWKYSFKDLDEFDENGIAYDYTVDELDIDGYSKSYDGNNLINTRTGKIDLTARKVWVDGPEEKPTIELQLYRNGKALEDELVTLENGKTSYTWKDLDLTDEKGVEYEYRVDEVNIPKNYEKTVGEDGLTITNKYIEPEDPEEPEDPDKPGSKDPDDPDSDDPKDEDPNKPGSDDPDKPEEETPTVPTDPSRPGGPDDPTRPGGPKDPNRPGYEDGKLVQTGTDINFLIPIGITIMLIGLAFVFKERFNKE